MIKKILLLASVSIMTCLCACGTGESYKADSDGNQNVEILETNVNTSNVLGENRIKKFEFTQEQLNKTLRELTHDGYVSFEYIRNDDNHRPFEGPTRVEEIPVDFDMTFSELTDNGMANYSYTIGDEVGYKKVFLEDDITSSSGVVSSVPNTYSFSKVAIEKTLGELTDNGDISYEYNVIDDNGQVLSWDVSYVEQIPVDFTMTFGELTNNGKANYSYNSGDSVGYKTVFVDEEGLKEYITVSSDDVEGKAHWNSSKGIFEFGGTYWDDAKGVLVSDETASVDNYNSDDGGLTCVGYNGSAKVMEFGNGDWDESFGVYMSCD